MNLGTFATFLATLIFGIISTYLIVTANLEKTIANKLNDPSFIKQIAEHIRIPFLIFDENETYVVDGGGSNFIKKINVVKDEGLIVKVILTLEKKTNIAPILYCLNNDVQFHQGKPTKESGWEYETLLFSNQFVSHAEKTLIKMFKVEILEGYSG